MKRRVVITGSGAVTALGEGAGSLWDGVVASRSGIDFLSDSGDGWKPAGGYVRDFNPEKFVTQRKALKVMARDIQLAVAAASLALEDAYAKDAGLNKERSGVIVGSGVLNHELEELVYSVQNSLEDGELDLKKFGEEGLRLLFPLWLLKYLPNMSACHVSILFGLEGPNNTITTGASAGLQAVGEAFHIVERGSADLMLAGGAESKLNPVGLAEYQLLGVLSKTNGGDPKKIYRPFDAGAGGVVVGEGAGFLVLEELEHAKKRGAKILAEIAGFGSLSSVGRVSAMRAALRNAGISPSDIDYLQACGLGIAEEDRLEAEAVNAVFKGQKDLLVTASKPVIGFTGFSSGPIDLIVSLFALQNGTVPPVMNLKDPVVRWDFEVVKDAPVRKKINYAMTNAFGLNGQSVSIIIKPYVH